MSLKVCLAAKTLDYPKGGGIFWTYLNWALSLRALGLELLWLEEVTPNTNVRQLSKQLAALKHHLQAYGLADVVRLCSMVGNESASDFPWLGREEAAETDLLLNMAYSIPAKIVESFPRTALLELDPGLTQLWISEGNLVLPRHDLYFTIGETVGQPNALFPDCGLEWHYSPPMVFLPEWPVTVAAEDAPYTTVTHWWYEFIMYGGQSYSNSKRDGFLPFLELPRRTKQRLELAVSWSSDPADRIEQNTLKKNGWLLIDSRKVTASPKDYQTYIHRSQGEFTCVKPYYVHLQTAWIGDRTISYLASGKPAIMQHTGPSRFLPETAGLFRFRTLEEAVQCLEEASRDYDKHGRLARSLAEEYFDGEKVAAKLLERALL